MSRIDWLVSGQKRLARGRLGLWYAHCRERRPIRLELPTDFGSAWHEAMSRLTGRGVAMKYVLIGLLKLYRLLISPLYGNVCRYYPSCSAYALRGS